MKLVHEPSELQSITREAAVSGQTVGLVPTMGALHQGHLSLVRRARQECDLVVASIFVNPAQFGPAEDLGSYPRTLEHDTSEAERAGTDLLFVPSAAAMYPYGYQTHVEPGRLASGLCGQSRPGHFRGVATVVLKLLLLSNATTAYFGRKDYQQLRVIEQMVLDFHVGARIIACPIIREADGLAMSSRNRYLSHAERAAAVVLSRALAEAERVWADGERDAGELSRVVLDAVAREPLARLEYAEVVDARSLEPPGPDPEEVLVALAVFIGNTRLIDNTVLDAACFGSGCG